MFSHVKPLLRLQFLNYLHQARTHNRGLLAISLAKAPMQIYLCLYSTTQPLFHSPFWILSLLMFPSTLIPTFRRTAKIEQQNTGESIGYDVTNHNIASLQCPIFYSDDLRTWASFNLSTSTANIPTSVSFIIAPWTLAYHSEAMYNTFSTLRSLHLLPFLSLSI